jgi:CheY-like chemotaxis protein
MSEGSAAGNTKEALSEKKVLIVDDEAATRALLRTTVQGTAIPCRILEAVDGDTAVEIARRTRPDLVLLDIVLPGSASSGVFVCQQLCKDRRTKVVIVSGQAGDAVVRACLSVGALAHVKKPFSVPEVRAKIEEWLAD